MSRRATLPSLDEMLARGRVKAGHLAEVDPQSTIPSVLEDERLRVRRRAMATHGFGLPEHAADLVVADRLYSTQALTTAQAWVQAPTPVLVMVGEPGVGKSVACAWAALERVAKGGIAYVLESDLAEWRWARRQHEADWQRVIEAGTVIVDELGRTESARRELARVAVAELVHHRTGGWPKGRRTMLLGNLTLDDLDEALDPRLSDRLVEIGSVRHIRGPSLRTPGGRR